MYLLTTLLLYSNHPPNTLQTCNSAFSSTFEPSLRLHGTYHPIYYLRLSAHSLFRSGGTFRFTVDRFLFFLVLNVGQSFDVKTRVREFCTGKMSHSISHRYVPLGPPTHSNGGSSGNGGGAAQKPKPGTGSGGQTNSSAGSTKNSK